MYLEVYIDIYFFINLFMDLVLLLLVRKILKWNGRLLRILAASIIGSVIACIFAVYPSLYGLIKFMIAYLFTCFFMIWVAFRVRQWKDLIKGAVVLYVVTFCMGGLISSLYYQRKTISYYIDLVGVHLFHGMDTRYIIAATIGSILLISAVISTYKKQKQLNKEIYQINLVWEHSSIETKGLVDTGNCLFDPITGKPVIVVELGLMHELFDASLYEDLIRVTELENNNYQISDENVTKIRLIPFQSLGKKRGILPAVVLDEVIIHRNTEKICSKHVIAAIYNEHLSPRNEYQVILHRSLL